LEAEGRVTRRATLDIDDLPPPVRLPSGSRRISEALDEQREDRV
jgi:hypothetical protein